MSKNDFEIAGDIVIAWINAKAQSTVAQAGAPKDRGIPTADEVAEFYKTIIKSVSNPNS